jgi:hypothetical protein
MLCTDRHKSGRVSAPEPQAGPFHAGEVNAKPFDRRRLPAGAGSSASPRRGAIFAVVAAQAGAPETLSALA